MNYYLKYRPQKIKDLDLTDVRDNLLGILSKGELAHAYFFVGPKGSGKTSAARILAQVVNCESGNTSKLKEPCGKCEVCKGIKQGSQVDILEMDAASHRSIDDIRDLKEKINLSPVRLKTKVYIIDEVHMLTREAFNALLKVLEEPPAQVMFFLCTTEEDKVPETIVSRCAKVVFSKASKEEMMGSLMKVVEGEKLEIEKEALELLAESVDGSFREGHKILEQLSSGKGKIDRKRVEKILGLAGNDDVAKLLRLTFLGEVEKISGMFRKMENKGVDAAALLRSLLVCLQTEIRQDVSLAKKPDAKLKLTERLIEANEKLKISPLPFLPIELTLLQTGLEIGEREKGGEPEIKEKAPSLEVKEKIPSVKVKERVVNSNNLSFDKIEEEWGKFLDNLSNKNRSVAGLLRASKPKVVEGNRLTVEVFYEFHKNQLEQDAKRMLIEKTAAELWGPTILRCVLGERQKKRSETGDRMVADNEENVFSQEDDALIKTAEDVFGN